MKLADMEQISLTKDMQYLEIIETLKEEIRVLEGLLYLLYICLVIYAIIMRF